MKRGSNAIARDSRSHTAPTDKKDATSEVDVNTRKRRVAVAQVAILKLLALGVTQRLASSTANGTIQDN